MRRIAWRSKSRTPARVSRKVFPSPLQFRRSTGISCQLWTGNRLLSHVSRCSRCAAQQSARAHRVWLSLSIIAVITQVDKSGTRTIHKYDLTGYREKFWINTKSCSPGRSRRRLIGKYFTPFPNAFPSLLRKRRWQLEFNRDTLKGTCFPPEGLDWKSFVDWKPRSWISRWMRWYTCSCPTVARWSRFSLGVRFAHSSCDKLSRVMLKTDKQVLFDVPSLIARVPVWTVIHVV